MLRILAQILELRFGADLSCCRQQPVWRRMMREPDQGAPCCLFMRRTYPDYAKSKVVWQKVSEVLYSKVRHGAACSDDA